jgi:Icc-related predicted phosphoesterase
MRLQIFSDLHCDLAPTKPIAVGGDVDAVAVAGDISEGARNSFVALRRIVPEAIPILFVMGNHEFYRRFLGVELETAKAIGPDYNVRVLSDDVAFLNGVRFAGATLWTDYRIFGARNAPAAMSAARTGMNDHRLIGWKKEPWERFRPQEALMLHASSRRFFKETLADPFDGATVILSHTAPHIRSVPEHHRSDILTAAFASDLSELLGVDKTESGEAPATLQAPAEILWIHGHIHASSDYRIGAVRVVANPHGYAGENPAFDPMLIIEVGT